MKQFNVSKWTFEEIILPFYFFSTNTCLKIPRFKDNQLLVKMKKSKINKVIYCNEYLNDVSMSILQATLDGYSRDVIIAM